MKRYLSLALTMFFLFTSIFSSIGHAANYGRIQVSMNNNKIDVTQVPITMDGKEVETEYPSFILKGRTFVPIRFLENNYGAEVIWEVQGENKNVIVKHNDGQVVKLTIDSPIALINEEKTILDKASIPRLVTFSDGVPKTMVPLSFLSETLGFKAEWDDVNKVPYIISKENDDSLIDKPSDPEMETGLRIISKIIVNKGSTDKNKIIIESDKKLYYETELLEEKSIFVIDIKGARLLQENKMDAPGSIVVNDDNIKEVRYSQFSYEPDITRIAIDLKEKNIPDIIPGTDGKGLMISFENNSMKSVTKEVVNGEEAIVLNGVDYKSMNIIKLKNPERLVFDFLDSVLEGEPYVEYPYDLGFIKGVRVSQFKIDNNYSASDQIVRVVLDIKDGISDPNVKIDTNDKKIIIYPEKSFWEDISYEKLGDERHFILNNLIDTDHDLNYDNVTKTLEVIIPSENVDLNDGLIIIKDELLDGIRIKKGEVETLISLQFRRSIEYIELENDIDKKVHLVIKKNSEISPKDRLIVIDAGHGGKDPGAISVTKKKEKDFNLIVALKLNQRLQDLGYNTILTRETDEFIDLYERARIANDNYADVFISIHANANNKKEIAGIQMLYCPAFNSEVKEGDQHPFAKAVMEGMLNATGAPDKGIIQRPKLVVLRETKMPAVLVEAGFLSNAAEEQLLYTDEYQNKVVDGIVDGVENYFEID